MFILLSKSFLFLNEIDFKTCEDDPQTNRCLVFNLKDDFSEPLTLEWPPASVSTNGNQSKSISFRIVCGCVSESENYFALCDDKKNLVILNRQFETISHYLVKRTFVKIFFKSNEETILGCDKSGDIYEFELLNSNSQGKLLLGHCSMLLDFTMTKNSQYILSCDRDEKIRVTHYPNTYNILSYCLGHSEFVSSIVLLDQETLISGSGDGKIIVWNFFNGEKIYSLNCDENQKEKKEKSQFPIKSITADREMANFVVVSFYKQSFVQLYKVVREFNRFISLQLSYKLVLDTEPVWLQFDLAHTNFIWISGGLHDKSIELFELKQDKLESAFCNVKIVNTLNKSEQLKVTLENDHKENAVDGLFKHYYNNVELYYQRKMQRIENENKTKRFI